MAALLRAKYTQHPNLAQTLHASGDARISYVDVDSAYWSIGSTQGTNWTGRLLEIIRSELAAADTGILLPATHDADRPTSPRPQEPVGDDGGPLPATVTLVP